MYIAVIFERCRLISIQESACILHLAYSKAKLLEVADLDKLSLAVVRHVSLIFEIYFGLKCDIIIRNRPVYVVANTCESTMT